MPEETRTLTQVTKEIEQAAAKVTSAKASMENAQKELMKLIGERNQIEAELLKGTGFGPSPLQSTTDGHPVEEPNRRRRSTSARTAVDGKTEAEVRAWLKANGHKKLNPGRLAENYWNIYNNNGH